MILRFRLGTFFAAWLDALLGLVLVLPLGLIVIEWLIIPLAVMIAALLAALSTGWAGSPVTAIARPAGTGWGDSYANSLRGKVK